MTVRLAVASVRRRWGSFVGTFLAGVLAVALLAGSGLLLAAALAAPPGADRFGAVDMVVSGPRSVTLTTMSQKKDKTKVKTKSTPLTGAAALPPEVVAAVAATPGVATVVPDTVFVVALDHTGSPIRPAGGATVVAHGWTSAALTPYTLRTGAPPRFGEAVLDVSLADGLHVGDIVRLTGRTGAVDLRLSGFTTDAVPGQAAVFVADAQVAALSGLAGPTAVAVRVAPGADRSAVAAALGRIGDGMAVHTGEDKAAADLPGAMPDYTGAVSVCGFVLGITGFAAVFVLLGTVALAVRQRLRELALLRTIGATPRQVRRLLAAETALVAVVAAVPGLPVGVVVAHLVAGRFRALGVVPRQFTVTTNPVVLVAAALVGVLATLAATLPAARRTVRTAPTQALREAVADAPRCRAARIATALALVGGAAAVLGFVPLDGPFGMGMGFIACALLLCAVAVLGPFAVGAVSGVAARAAGLGGGLGQVAGAMTRGRSRHVAMVALPLTLAFALNATMLVDGDVLQRVTADQQAARTAPAALRVTATNAPGLPLDTVARITALPSVTGSAAVLGSRVITDEGGKPQHHPAQGLRLTGEPALDLDVTAGSLADLVTGTVAVSASLAAQRGWRVGDRALLWLADGTRTTPTVVAVYQRWRGFGDVVLPAEVVAAHDPVGLAGAVYLRGGPGVAAAVGAGLPRSAAIDAGSAAAGSGEEPNQAAAWELMVAITLAFAALAIANTFAVATTARRREFGRLRLAGATPRQLHRMLDVEALITVATGLVLGCLISGAVVGVFSVAQDGRWRLFADPLHYLGLLGGVGLLGVVAGSLSARWVVRRRRPAAAVGRLSADG